MIMKFDSLYAGDVENQRIRYENLFNDFAAFFKNKENVEFFSAPGRTEVGGNHTDHQHGKVLAAAVNLDIIAAAQKRTDNVIVLKSAEYKKYDTVDITKLSAVSEEKERSSALIRGICARCKELGYNIGGFNAFTVTTF